MGAVRHCIHKILPVLKVLPALGIVFCGNERKQAQQAMKAFLERNHTIGRQFDSSAV
jgi:hypothetical protein